MPRSQEEEEIINMDKPVRWPVKMSFRLLKEITNCFSEDRTLGVGAYGSVYVGEHRERGKIAVKLFHDIARFDDAQFEKECHNLARLQHKNIVQLVGYCQETNVEPVQLEGRYDFAKMSKRALCFEYMHNGSLSSCLSDESNGHNWRTRYAIIKGICEGLKYLHEELEYSMYHFDLKPKNILLDETMTPKITDLGLLRISGGDQEKTSTCGLGCVGTIGYSPPEYLCKRLISNKCDIFNLGGIIINIITGPEGYARSSEIPSHEFIEHVHGNWRNRLEETSMDELEPCCKQVKKCIEIALSCVEGDRHKRPSIGVIVDELNRTETISQLFGALGNFNGLSVGKVRQAAPVTQNSGKIGFLSAPQVRPEEISSAKPTSSPSQMPGSQMRSEPHYSLQHLKDITRNFSEEQILGKGGSGLVYKGLLANGKMIAVKKVEQRWSSKEQCDILQKQFENEVNLLMGLKHPNIVELLGYCYEMQHERSPHNGTYMFCWQVDSLLCLEFLSEGSLDKRISDATSGLDWHTRYKIIEGICYGLQYLHEQSDVPILHLDLKPGNILLNANMVPKIADFGISRLFDQGQTIHTKNTNGTPGYMPPEFIQAGTITLMSDIFSLGVIIMEIIMGHKNYPYDIKASYGDFINTELQKWRNMMEKEPGYRSLETDCQQIEKCIRIGLMCVNLERAERPTIRKITNMLQGQESTNCYISE